MNLLLAHHIEAQHVPVLLILFAAGIYIGWELLGRCLPRKQPAMDEYRKPTP